jgi:hypothetical protein
MTLPTRTFGALLALAVVACSDPDPVFTEAAPLPVQPGPEPMPRPPEAEPSNETPDPPPVDMLPPTDVDGNGPDGEDPDEPPPEDAPPFIVSVSPENGAAGVEDDAVLVITFSEPMDRQATESAYLSEDLPSGEVTFTWNEDSTVLTITPDLPLLLAAGGDPEAVTALDYTYVVSDLARDAQGEALLARAFSFSTARQITQTYAAIQDRDLTGNFRGNGSYGNGDCARNQTTVCIGDSDNPGDFQFRGFLSFDLRALPADIKRLTMAELSFEVADTNGNAFNGLGDLLAEQVSFEVIDAAAFDVEPLAGLGVVATSADEGSLIEIDVSGVILADAAAERMTQLRLRFQQDTDNDGNADLIISDWSTQQIRVVFLMD